eukprot:GEMP01049226.1.p1 GENE.GEMP01049226.1~~GEMP01049226.1.p1  ORF type:complete len:221 (+),score=33.58 GEMP01049226.1:169-831(+)
MGDNASEIRCFKCNKKVPWTEAGLQCKCQLLFCEKHRFPEDHKCTFNYHEEYKAKLLKENPRVVLDGSMASNYQQFSDAHRKQHPERLFLRFHSAGFLIFLFFLCKGLWGALKTRAIILPQQVLIGYVVGFAVAHAIPVVIRYKYYPNLLLYSSVTGGCRCCFFSWDLIRQPQWTLQVEQDALLHHLLDVVTANRSNCLSHLYQHPSWSKTATAVWQKVT